MIRRTHSTRGLSSLEHPTLTVGYFLNFANAHQHVGLLVFSSSLLGMRNALGSSPGGEMKYAHAIF